jgi:glycosyltransferase involved in cell wall biosynthesis
MASLVWFFVKLNRVKLVVTEHWTGYQPEDGNYKGAFRKLFTKLIIKNANTVITVSKQLAEAMGKHSLKFKNVVISNAVDLQVFKVSDKKINPNNFIHISSLDDRQKNICGIIRAFAEVVKQNNQTQLIIVGSGGDEMELRKLVGDLGLSGQVVFVGNKKGVELASLIKDSAALIMFSRYENQPVVILEALACGTPVISTYVGGIAEMLDESNSLKVEVENVQQLKGSMELILNDNKFFDAEQIQENILKTIHPDIIRNKHLELYKELLN